MDRRELPEEIELRRKIQSGEATLEDYLNLAKLLSELSRFEEIMAVYERVLTLPLSSRERAVICTSLAWDLFDGMDRPEEAVPRAQEALRLLADSTLADAEAAFYGGCSRGLLALSLCYSDQQTAIEMAEEALRDLNRALASHSIVQDERSAEFTDYLQARLYLLLRDSENAGRFARQAVQHAIAGHEMSRLSVLAQALQLAERFTEADAVLHQAIDTAQAEQKSHPKAFYQMGLLAKARGQADTARMCLEQAVVRLGAHPALSKDKMFLAHVKMDLADVYLSENNYAAAAEAYEDVLRLNEKNDDFERCALLGAGDCRTYLQDYSRARRHYEQVSASPHASEEQRSHAVQAILWLEGMRAQQVGQYAAARSTFRRLIDLNPKEQRARHRYLLWLAHCCVQVGEHSEARLCLEEVLKSPCATPEDTDAARESLAVLPPPTKLQ